MKLPWNSHLSRQQAIAARLALAGTAIAVVLALVAALSFRGSALGPGSSPTSVSASGTVASPLPTTSAATVSSPTASPSPRVISTGGGDCPEGANLAATGSAPGGGAVVRVAQPEGLSWVEWSPDGQHLVLAGWGGVELLDSSGRLQSSIPGAEAAAWLDPTTYATGSDCEASGVGSVTIHGLDGPSRTLPGIYDTTSLLGSGHGALALAPRLPDSTTDPTTTVVFDGSKLSTPVQGRPLAWSPDGTRLLVTKGELGAGSPAGAPAAIHLQLLAFPGLRIAASFGDLTTDPRYDPVFSPDGRTIAVYCGPLTATGTCSPWAFDTASGTGKKIVDWAPSRLSWVSDAVLLVSPPSGQPGRFSEWDGTSLSPSSLMSGSWAVATPGGLVIESAPAGDLGGSSDILWASGATTMGLPGATAVFWSPDGSRVLLQPRYSADLLLVRPG